MMEAAPTAMVLIIVWSLLDGMMFAAWWGRVSATPWTDKDEWYRRRGECNNNNFFKIFVTKDASRILPVVALEGAEILEKDSEEFGIQKKRLDY